MVQFGDESPQVEIFSPTEISIIKFTNTYKEWCETIGINFSKNDLDTILNTASSKQKTGQEIITNRKRCVFIKRVKTENEGIKFGVYNPLEKENSLDIDAYTILQLLLLKNGLCFEPDETLEILITTYLNWENISNMTKKWLIENKNKLMESPTLKNSNLNGLIDYCHKIYDKEQPPTTPTLSSAYLQKYSRLPHLP